MNVSEDAFAVFNRAIGKLQASNSGASNSGALQDHPGLPKILTRYAIRRVR